MISARRSCRNKPDIFCYICGEYTIVANRKSVTSFIKRVYLAYFGIKIGDQDKEWAPHTVCKICTEALRQWTYGKRNLKFGIPMVWREPANHITDCYFCAIDLNGINRKNRGIVKYLDLHSARRPVAHCDEIPVPICKELPDVSHEDVSSIEVQEEEKGADVDFEYDTRQRFSQQE